MALSTTTIPSAALSKIQRWMSAKKAAGQTVQPWEMEAAFEGEMDSVAGQQTQNRSLSLQADRDAETKRMNDINANLKQEEIDAGKTSAITGTVTNAALLNYAMKDPETGTTPIGNLYDKIMGPKTTVPTTTTTPPTTPTGVPMANAEPYNPMVGNPAPYEYNPVGEATAATAATDAAASTVGATGEAIGGGAIDMTEAGLMSGAEGASAAGGATLTGILGTAAPYVALGKIGMPYAGQYSSDAFSKVGLGEEGSSNVFQQHARMVGRGQEGVMTPMYEELTGNKMPTAISAITNPAGAALKWMDSTWLCTEVAKYVGVSAEDQTALKKLRRYSLKNHKPWLKEYLDKGKLLVEKINESIPSAEGRTAFYGELKKNMVDPVVWLTSQGREDEAFFKYKAVTLELFDKYLPGIITMNRDAEVPDVAK